jgi:hypothetical protein
MMPVRFLAAGVIVLAALVLAPSPAIACSCASRPLAEQVRHADSIGVGAVAWISEGAKQTTVAVDFARVYKGELGSREKVLTPASGAACGLDLLQTGHNYAFFVEGMHRGRITASLCGGTTASTAQLDDRLERITGPPRDPVPVDESLLDEPGRGHWWWVWIGGGALVLTAGAAWWSSRRGGGPLPG